MQGGALCATLDLAPVRGQVRWRRVVLWSFVAIAVQMALLPLCLILSNLLTGPALALFTLGIFSHRANAAGAICGKPMLIQPSGVCL